jgi:hypothetical protein
MWLDRKNNYLPAVDLKAGRFMEHGKTIWAEMAI